MRHRETTKPPRRLVVAKRALQPAARLRRPASTEPRTVGSCTLPRRNAMPRVAKANAASRARMASGDSGCAVLLRIRRAVAFTVGLPCWRRTDRHVNPGPVAQFYFFLDFAPKAKFLVVGNQLRDRALERGGGAAKGSGTAIQIADRDLGELALQGVRVRRAAQQVDRGDHVTIADPAQDQAAEYGRATSVRRIDGGFDATRPPARASTPWSTTNLPRRPRRSIGRPRRHRAGGSGASSPAAPLPRPGPRWPIGRRVRAAARTVARRRPNRRAGPPVTDVIGLPKGG